MNTQVLLVLAVTVAGAVGALVLFRKQAARQAEAERERRDSDSR